MVINLPPLEDKLCRPLIAGQTAGTNGLKKIEKKFVLKFFFSIFFLFKILKFFFFSGNSAIYSIF